VDCDPACDCSDRRCVPGVPETALRNTCIIGAIFCYLNFLFLFNGFVAKFEVTEISRSKL